MKLTPLAGNIRCTQIDCW